MVERVVLGWVKELGGHLLVVLDWGRWVCIVNKALFSECNFGSFAFVLNTKANLCNYLFMLLCILISAVVQAPFSSGGERADLCRLQKLVHKTFRGGDSPLARN